MLRGAGVEAQAETAARAETIAVAGEDTRAEAGQGPGAEAEAAAGAGAGWVEGAAAVAAGGGVGAAGGLGVGSLCPGPTCSRLHRSSISRSSKRGCERCSNSDSSGWLMQGQMISSMTGRRMQSCV